MSYKIPTAFAGTSGFPNTPSSVQQMLSSPHKVEHNRGFSLAEVLVALMIGAAVLVAMVGIYNYAERSVSAVTYRLDSFRLPCEVLQRIAEDLDEIIAAGSDTSITIERSFEEGYPTARLTIEKTYGSGDERQTFEKIIWQTKYDSDADSLVLYRSHSGIGLEDKLLDESKDDSERELFVPICDGITFFKIQVPTYKRFRDKELDEYRVYEEFQDRWTSNSLPKAVVVTISFAEPFETLEGTLDVPEEEKIARVIAIDRTRKVSFLLPKKEYEDEEEQQEEEEEQEEEQDEEEQIDKQEDKEDEKVEEQEEDNEKREFKPEE